MWVTLGESFTNSGSVVAWRVVLHELGENDRVLAKFDPAALHVWARRVDLEAGDSRNPCEPLAHFGVAVDVGLEHACDHRDTFWDRGKFFADERLDAYVFEADCVEHSPTVPPRFAEADSRPSARA